MANMFNRYPIYTEKTECLDCYKCVRQCPVKAISFENGHARVDHELCVFCGHCVEVCPAGAKRGRDDVRLVNAVLGQERKVILSIAPSWRGEFPEISEAQLSAAARSAGFAGVSETALGAEAVSKASAELMAVSDQNIFISSACPTVVEYIMKYHSESARYITGLLSPMLVHCRMLKEHYGQETDVVFAGPCLSKKREADEHPELCRAAITYRELMRLFESRGVDLNAVDADDDDHFLAGKSGVASRYPYEGGMIESVRSYTTGTKQSKELVSMSISGLEEIEDALTDLPEELSVRGSKKNLFLELLACRGGCINGPGSVCKGTVKKRMGILSSAGTEASLPEFSGKVDGNWHYQIPRRKRASDKEIREMLGRIGKFSLDDELNCGGCGYNTCREFAAACLDGRAETVMCVSHMRKLAQKKANTIIEKMPSGVVIVDDQLTIIECNRRFAELAGEDAMLMWEARPKLEGAMITRLVPFHQLFETVLDRGNEIIDRNIQFGDKVLSATVFPIVKGQSVCAIIQDVTAPWVNRDKIIKKAQDVISKNLETVQQIAYLLGENASENEVILNSIIESFQGGANG